MRASLNGAMVLLLLCAGVQAVTGEEYVYADQWGSVGTTEGKFQDMGGIAVDASGRVYVADGGWIQRFTSTGGFVTRWNTQVACHDVDVDSHGNVYTPQHWEDGSSHSRVAKYDLDGDLLQQWNGVRDVPFGVTVDTAGNVIVVSHISFSTMTEGFVSVYAPTGGFLRQWGYTEDYPFPNLTLDGHMPKPLGVAADAAGNIYVVDVRTHRVQKFTSNGDFVTKWGANGGDGTSGSGDGEFDSPLGIAVDTHGDVYVADTGNHRIQKFRSDGTFVVKWGTYGSANGQLDHPADVDVDPAGFVYVADAWNNRVQKYAPILQPDFTATPKIGMAPMTVQFTDQTTGGQPLSWLWDFGDGGHSTLTNPSHTYTEPGIYAVSLTVTNAISGSRTRTQGHYIAVAQPLVANFTASPRIGYAPLSVQFTDTSTGSPTGWEWYFGDGGTSTVQNPHHTYANPGAYRVTLVASKAAGTNSTYRQNYVYVLPLAGPFTIQAEDYDDGGEGVAYHDTTATNEGGVYRGDGVDIEAFERGYVVSRIRDGEWTRYTIPSAAAVNHDYTLTLRVSTRTTGEQVSVRVDGFRDEVVVDLPDTGSLSNYVDVPATLRLHPGTNTVRFTFNGDYTNVDYLVLDPGTIDPLQTVQGGSGLPTDTDGDGRFDDVNGNGRRDFADVVLYFNQMTWIAANEPVLAFDYNANGRIDFADVVWLFNHL